MVSTMPWIDKLGLSVVRTCSTVCSNCDRPSSAKNSHCSGTRIASDCGARWCSASRSHRAGGRRGLELELGSTAGRAFRLRDAIAALNTNATPDTDYTYVLIDCPPSLNLLTVNAMAASDAILVPLQCEFFALEGLSQLLQTVEQVRTTLNPNLSIHGIVLTMFDSRNNLANQVVADVRQFMGSKVYNTMIPRNVRISEAPSYGKPVLVYDLKCVGSEAYLKLATEVIQRERELRAH